MTPYQTHAALDHGPMGQHSPNGLDIIEECDTCGGRWLLTPGYPWPVTLDNRAAMDALRNIERPGFGRVRLPPGAVTRDNPG